MEQELPTLPEHLDSPPVFGGIRAAQSIVFSVVFYRSLFVPLSFSLVHCTVYPSPIYDSDYHFGIFKLFLFVCKPFVKAKVSVDYNILNGN